MVTCKLQGGLGNQMFQIAATYGLAKRSNDIYAFNFNDCDTPYQGHKASKYYSSYFNKLPLIENIFDLDIYNETTFSYKEIPIYKNGVKLNGYFQSEKYFKNYSFEIKNLFNNFTEQQESNVLNFFNSLDVKINQFSGEITAVHVRRGDYLNNESFHNNLGKSDYYQNAMKMIGGKFIFISDDIEWCRENFKGDNIIYSPFTEELDDLCLMVWCENHIIANSTFSWWGAYLNRNAINKQKVIAPNNWFGMEGPQDTEDLIPDRWIKIRTE